MIIIVSSIPDQPSPPIATQPSEPVQEPSQPASPSGPMVVNPPAAQAPPSPAPVPPALKDSPERVDQLAHQMQSTPSDSEQYNILRRLFKTIVPSSSQTVLEYAKSVLMARKLDPEEAERCIWQAAKNTESSFMGSLHSQLRSLSRQRQYETSGLKDAQLKMLRRFAPIINGEVPIPEDIFNDPSKNMAEKILDTYKRTKWGGQERVNNAMAWWDQKYSELAASEFGQREQLQPLTLRSSGHKHGLPSKKKVGKNVSYMEYMEDAFNKACLMDPELASRLGISMDLYNLPSSPMYLITDMVYPERRMINTQSVQGAIDIIGSGGNVRVDVGKEDAPSMAVPESARDRSREFADLEEQRRRERLRRPRAPAIAPAAPQMPPTSPTASQEVQKSWLQDQQRRKRLM